MIPFYFLRLTHPQNYSSRCTSYLIFQHSWTSCYCLNTSSKSLDSIFLHEVLKILLKTSTFVYIFLFWGLWDLSSPDERLNLDLTVKALTPNHETTGGLPGILLLFSCPVVSNSLRPPGLQNTRLPCPLSSPRACLSSCPLHWWCHPANSSSDAFFSF